MTWTPVTERLPDKNGQYIVCQNDKIVFTALFVLYKRAFVDGSDINDVVWRVTHWMPFPEPPNDDYCGVPLIEERRRMTNER